VCIAGGAAVGDGGVPARAEALARRSRLRSHPEKTFDAQQKSQNGPAWATTRLGS